MTFTLHEAGRRSASFDSLSFIGISPVFRIGVGVVRR